MLTCTTNNKIPITILPTQVLVATCKYVEQGKVRLKAD